MIAVTWFWMTMMISMMAMMIEGDKDDDDDEHEHNGKNSKIVLRGVLAGAGYRGRESLYHHCR